MSRVLGIVSGMGMLIAVYLFLNNAKQTTQIIDSIAGNGVKGIKTLQGR
ncbi:Uncharacterised protein [Streptococcus pneumoniae]|nr:MULTISPECIES: hypothetical protein [Bacilli]CKE75959.1 Uncharacterised protein [Streptococcus pneumoniae]CKE78514.1 Uncharacterised protein [Streptococcus pneumoniae]CKE88132.1 Uncharacterised protein [Streptococcus pneumoniae]CKF08343.1 Uncharacterised protein [Streptococcus pneumoniae]CKF17288.1 Uncharacterised protein [Streptococcus pneumoniae]